MDMQGEKLYVGEKGYERSKNTGYGRSALSSS